ncbi:class I SAM-dependent methyltransferase [Amycolatopsis thailandensis]|uniref:class I SAM-dependent methyltransferase n=1 Tax=Amycolatopsis thailandensis TaxID=589330 RepID=UPI003643B22A
MRDLAARLNSGDQGTAARVAAWRELLGEASSVLVGLPLEAAGRDAAAAALLGGAQVVLAEPDVPARVLATLERGGADHAIVDSALLAALSAEPAAGMTDLSTLRRVLYLGGPAEFGDIPTLRLREGTDGVVAPAEDRDTEAAVLSAIEAVQAPAVTPGHAAEFVARLDEAVLASMLHTLQRYDVLSDPAVSHDPAEVLAAAGVAERHEAVVTRWLTTLCERGVVSRDGDLVRGAGRISTDTVAAAWAAAKESWTCGLGDAAVIDYFRLNADRLPELMSGSEQATLLLFPEGRTDVADALYRHTAIARHLNAAVAAAVTVLAVDGGRLRVLEIGAGTGATSEVVFGELAESGTHGVDYHFTDVSAFFLSAAQERFAEHEYVRYGIYDADRGNRDQGFTPGSADVIIAAGALNNARDTDATLRRVRELLAPGGWLLVTEPTREYLEILISQAFMMTAAEDARLRSGTTFLTRAQWLEALERAGFTQVHTTPGDDHPLAPMSQYLFAAPR